MNINDKYAANRPYINNGDVMLIRGNSFLAKSIQWADKSYYNHALLVWKGSDDRLFAIQAQQDGVVPFYLSQEIAANIDFCILRPKFEQWIIDKNVKTAMDASEAGIPYNKAMILQILMQRKLGWDVKKIGDNKKKDICSMFTGIRYGTLFPISCWSESAQYEHDNFLTPQDLLRFAKPDQITTLFNDFVG